MFLNLSTLAKLCGVSHGVYYVGEPIRIVMHLVVTVTLSLYSPYSHNKYKTPVSCLTELLTKIHATSSHLAFDKIAWLKSHSIILESEILMFSVTSSMTLISDIKSKNKLPFHVLLNKLRLIIIFPVNIFMALL